MTLRDSLLVLAIAIIITLIMVLGIFIEAHLPRQPLMTASPTPTVYITGGSIDVSGTNATK